MKRLRRIAALGVAGGVAAWSPIAGSAWSAPTIAAAPSVVDRPLRLQVVDQTFGVANGDAMTVSFELTGSPDDVGSLAAAVTPPTTAAPTSIETSTTAAPAGESTTLPPAPTSPPAPDPAAATTTTFEATTMDAASGTAAPATVVVTAHDRVVTADQLARLDEQGPAWTSDTVELPVTRVITFADGRLLGEIAVPIGIEEPADDPATGLNLGEPGIYPVTLDVRVAGEVVASSMTFVELIDPQADIGAPLAVSIMAGIRDPGPWPSPTELNGASIDLAEMVELADAVDGPLNIAVPPVVVGELTAPAAGADGTTATTEPTATSTPSSDPPIVTAGEPPSSPGSTEPAFEGIGSPDALLDAFRSDELLAVPAVALDPSSIVAPNQRDLFTRQLRLGEDTLSTASPRAVVSRAVWLTDGSISSDAVVMLRNLGIRLLVVPNDVANGLGVPTESPLASVFRVSLGGEGTLPAMTFSPLGEMLQAPPPSDTAPTPNDSAIRLLVELHLARTTTDVPAVLLAAPRVTVPDPAITAQFVALADDMPDISVVPISRLPGIVDGALAGGGPPIALPPSAGIGLAARLARVEAVRDDASDAAQMLVESNQAAAWTAELDRVMSTAVDDATAFEHLAETEAEIDAVRGAIVPPEPFTFTITGTRSTLPLTIRNTGTEPLLVRVRVRSSKIISEQPEDQVVPPEGSAEFRVAVEARSNGTFTIEVDVLTPGGARLTAPVVLKANVSRVLGLSQVVTGGAALVLASWWFSDLRRSRRRRLAAVGAGSVEAAAPVEAVSPDAAEAQAPPPESPELPNPTSEPPGKHR